VEWVGEKGDYQKADDGCGWVAIANGNENKSTEPFQTQLAPASAGLLLPASSSCPLVPFHLLLGLYSGAFSLSSLLPFFSHLLYLTLFGGTAFSVQNPFSVWCWSPLLVILTTVSVFNSNLSILPMARLHQVPQIAISLAPPQVHVQEPFSPFSATMQTSVREPDSPRSALLSPPPTLSPRSPRRLSPLRPDDVPVAGRQGVEREKFEAMLKASRERNAALGGKKSVDLRKEIAMKVHKSKQVERRALFLSKVMAPPSPTATLTPKTPPESPAIFHYSLPSPGLESPLEVFEMLALENPADPNRAVWVEQVDFRVPGQIRIQAPPRQKPTFSRKKLPSLDQITARLSFQGHVSTGESVREAGALANGRLPAFLRSQKRAPASPAPVRSAPVAVGRLQFPTRLNTAKAEERTPVQLPPQSPSSPVAPKLQVTTLVVPRTSFASPTRFTEGNLRTFDACSREAKARDMLSRLRRRTLPPNAEVFADLAAAQAQAAKDREEERKLRRHSAPPELPLAERVGFQNPLLSVPGAF